jgi:Rho termination factor, N-terminal domain
MTKAELESKHIAELHDLAAEAGVERYRMLTRAELIERLSGGQSQAKSKPRGGGRGEEPGRRRQQRDRKPRGERRPREGGQADRKQRREPGPEPSAAPATTPPPAASQPKRKRRRRRWGRRRKGVRVRDLLLPAAGRQTIVYGDNRAACTVLLREVAAELSDASKGPDPIALLVDPSPEELAEWKREAPQAEIVSAGKANHAGDALAQARARAEGGEDVIVLIDSLTRFAESFGGADEARELFDAGQGIGRGTLTVVAALERP